MQSTVTMMLGYKIWVNQLTFKLLTTVAPDELTKQRETVFGNILSTLNHVYVVDDIFLHHLNGKKHSYTERNTKDTPNLEQLAEKQNAMDLEITTLANALSAEEMNELIEFEFVGGGQGQMTRAEIFLHLVNHASYHRGFVGDMLMQIPVRSPANDLPVYLRTLRS